MCVEYQFQSRSTSQSLSSLAGETISPTISIASFIEPSQSAGGAGDGGTTSATGLPKRVTRMGFLVFCTCSRSARHLALNSEIATSFMTNLLDHSQLYWSTLTWGRLALSAVVCYLNSAVDR